MNRELREMYSQATYPGVMAVTGPELLRRLTELSREQALTALTAAVLRNAAEELADEIEDEPLQAARQAAVEPLAAVDAAREALAKEQQSAVGRLAAFWAAKRRSDPDDRERPPEQDTPKVQELRAALAEAEQTAQPFAQRAEYHRVQVAALRAAPAPDPAVMAILAEAMVGGHIEAVPA